MKIQLALGCVVLLGIVFGGSVLAEETSPEASPKELEAVDYQRQTIYHSPETPGYTCWVYAWKMPDKSIMVSFFQATGPKEGRPRAPMDVQKKLSWPHLSDPRRDLTGLNTRNIYLRSTDDGATWQKASEDSFETPMNGIVLGTTCLPDSSMLRLVNGAYLPYDADLPRTCLVQQSTDGTKTWGPKERILPPNDYLAYSVGIHRLRDGRIVVLGGVARGLADRAWSEYGPDMEPMLLVSDDNGKSWGSPIQVVPDENRKDWACEECDAAELPNGDLFWVFRRCLPEDADKPMDKRHHTYWQGLTEKHGNTWTPKWVRPSPFPNRGLPHLMMPSEGVIFLLNTCSWTADLGTTWHSVKNLPHMAYYPKGVQLEDGRILVFAHIGSDDPYGVKDQAIVMDSFRLLISR